MRVPLFVLLLLILTGCTKFEQVEKNEEDRLNTPEKLTKALTGAYSLLQDVFLYQDENMYQEVWYKNPNSQGDDFNHSPNRMGYYELIDGQWEYTCEDFYYTNMFDYIEVGSGWRLYYKVITTLNEIIVQFEEQDEIDSKFLPLLGEAYFLRAYTYFRLIRVHGQVPLIDDITVDYLVKKASFEELYSFIIDDLNQALEYLPENAQDVRKAGFTPHTGTAKAVQAEVYLNMGGYPLNQPEYYAEAARVAGEVIEHAGEYGFELIEDFADLWKITEFDEDYYSRKNWNREMVWSMQFEGFWGTMVHHTRQRFDGVIYVVGIRQSTSYPPGIKFYNNFPKSYRKSHTFFYLTTKHSSPNDSTNLNIQLTAVPDVMDLCSAIYYNKFSETWEADTTLPFGPSDPFPAMNQTLWDMNMYIYRYAQTLLTYAEAKARSGQLDASAYEAVNMVRRRAHHLNLYSPSEFDMTPGLDPVLFADSVVWERAWELCAEPEGRWFDLVRLERVEDLPILREAYDMMDYPDVIDKNFYYDPIPPSDILINPNLAE